VKLQTLVLVGGLLLTFPAASSAQDRPWTAGVAIGYAGLVDDATKNYVLIGGDLRRYVSPRVSVGAELATMSNSGLLRDRNVVLTGNVVFDVVESSDARRITPFVVGGGGIFWGRDALASGPYWSSDPAFTAGAGARVRLSDSVSAAAEYRFGWELHQRVNGVVSYSW
jgi:hypothetical protein